MDNNQLLETLEMLKNLSYDLRRNEVKRFPVETLEILAVKLYEEYLHKGYRKHTLFDILGTVLIERFKKINHNFEWTNENRIKFLTINNKITQVFEKAYNEAISTANELENRINNNDRFLSDFEIEIKIWTYMGEEFYDTHEGSSIGFVLSEPISGYYPINYSFGHNNLKNSLAEPPIYLDKSLNWNTEYIRGVFENDYIGYAIHALLDTSQWSFKDIINIKKIWANVEVVHQRYIEDI